MTAVLIFIMSLLGGPHHEAPRDCDGFVITARADEDVNCDLTKGQRLDLTGTTFDECMHYGGIWLIDDKGTCQDVDK